MSRSPSPRDPAAVPDSRDLRLAADWASAVRDEVVLFAYRDGRYHIGGEGMGGLPIRTRRYSVRPRVLAGSFAVPGATPYQFSADECSALVWGESAVEKFLFPYYVSAAGRDAARILADLTAVWYDYPASAPVCALAYRFGPRPCGGAITLESTVGVVFVNTCERRVEMLPLTEYMARYGSCRRQARANPVTIVEDSYPTAPLTSKLESIEIHEAAEFVSGLRGHFVWFTSPDGWRLVPTVRPDENPGVHPPPGTAIFGAVSLVERPDRPAPSAVTLVVREGDAGSPPIRYELLPFTDGASEIPDSAFWSDGAVEKLLVPYYSSVKGWTAPLLNMVMMAKWAGFIEPGDYSASCICTELKTMIDEYGEQVLDDTAPMLAATPRADTQDSTVFAVTHLPRSEYVNDTESMGVESRTRLHAMKAGLGASHSILGRTRARGER